ncbi:MAG: glycosyltransferase family 4 protein [Paludibacter sp.]|nr:glycosyltransferase family 4 protein [Paludibacter sp.]
MKNILVCAAFFSPHVGGQEVVIEKLAASLSAQGHRVDVLTNNTNHATIQEQSPSGFGITRLPCWNWLGGWFPVVKPSFKATSALWHIWFKHYDVIVTNTRFFQTSLFGGMIAHFRKIPLVHIEHGSQHSISPNKFVSLFGKIIDHSVGAWLAHISCKNVGVSEAAVDFLRHLGAKDSRVILNGIDQEMFKKTQTDLRSRLGIQEDALILSFVGRMIYAKGVQDLITVMSELKKNEFQMRLLIAGNGNYLEELKRITLQKECNDVILFLGELNRMQVVDLLSASDIFINPSYSEGLPTSVLEASAIGLPILATDVGGTREIVIHGKTGFLFPAGDTQRLKERLLELVGDSELRRNLGEAAMAFVKEKFDSNITTPGLCSFILEASND